VRFLHQDCPEIHCYFLRGGGADKNSGSCPAAGESPRSGWKLLRPGNDATTRLQSPLTCLQLVKLLLELFKLLPSFTELAFRCQSLIIR
jgi:hypothetical protein